MSGGDWVAIPPAKRFGRFLTEDAVEHIQSGSLLRFYSSDPWYPDRDGSDCPDLSDIVVFTGKVSLTFPKVGPHLEVASLDGRVYPGGGWVYRMFQFVADPPALPVVSEEMVEAAAKIWRAKIYPASPPSEFERDVFRAALTAAQSLPRPSPADKGEEPSAWAFEYLCDNGEHDEPSWEATASPLDPRRHKRPAFQYRNVQPLYARPSQGVSREAVAEVIAGFKGLSERCGPATQYHWKSALERADAILALINRGAA